MSPITAYRRLFSLVGPVYVLVAFLGRLPLAMSQMGTLLLVSSATGAYTLGGLAAGALAVANAVGSPIAGALADRIGQRPVVLAQSFVGSAGLAAIVILAQGGAGGGWLIAVAGLTGAAMPQVGPLARVRWRPITGRAGRESPQLVDAAFSYEGAADEASFVLGPALVGAVAVLIDPAGALLVAAGLLVVFGGWFALHPTAALVRGSRVGHAAKAGIVSAAFVILVGAQLLVGVLFGSIQTGATALATAEGVPGVSGLIHATLGVGSVMAGLSMAWVPARIGFDKRILVAAAALAVLSAPLVLVSSIAGMVAVVLVLGFAVAPYMISNFTLCERIVPLSRVGQAMTLLAGATGIGYAIGSTVAGRLADLGGYAPALGVTITAAWLALILALAGQRILGAAPHR
ncbi:MFS transporter [Mumia sp. zg.B17]|uniref:MFS transporter n=1 Tax=unclassified Mumia TaxID=2621872 RepID=UPI001C6E0A36|nr:MULTISPECIES: MFS transporter [unclassified Mumia]MBW9207067.1 MFS transporter [Mumia sp. zg.B17]MDD9348258.1 MFS transporter [Mumia sp.]